MENLLKTAIKHKEWHTAAEILIYFYAEYVEGHIESSKDKYNKYLKLVDLECISIIIDTTVFDHHRRSLTDALIKHALALN